MTCPTRPTPRAAMRRSPILRLAAALGAILLLVSQRPPATAGEPSALARRILDASGARGGIALHLGCGAGELTAALRVSDAWTVLGLDTDAGRVRSARARLGARGLLGPVTVERVADATLPFVDHLFNLVVVQEAGAVPDDEVMRVLVPGGVVCTLDGDRIATRRKARPAGLAEWSHFLGDASGNAVADDDRVGPPRGLQWVASPRWLRSHETPSGIQSPVTAGGRLFYYLDEGLIGITDERLPDRWSLVARDAFNGKLLWRRPLDAWGWREWSRSRYEGKDWTKLRAARTDVPVENQRRIVAGGDRLYATLSYRGPLSILDAASGETLHRVEGTEHASEILVAEGTAVVLTRPPGGDAARRRGQEAEAAALVAVDGRSGEVRWREPVPQVPPLAWAIDGGRVIGVSDGRLFARDLRTGREIWSVASPQKRPRTLLATKDTILLLAGAALAAHDARNGRRLWQKSKLPKIPGGEGVDLFVIDGLLWRGIQMVADDGAPVRKSPNALVVGRDLRTGEEKRRILVRNLRSPEHHHRCYRNRATSRYLISSFEGAEFLDFRGDDHSQNNWLRGACRHGMIPANGLLYVPPDQCFCQPGAKLLGYAAVRAAPATRVAPVADGARLLRGEAWGAVRGGQPAAPEDWPTYRGGPARHGASATSVPTPLTRRWAVDLGGRLTQPVAAAGKVFVAQVDAHTIHAIDLETGRRLWSFTAGGRIDSPPTYHDGLLLCGSRDGRVHCLRATDGATVWTFLAAPADRRLAAFGQVESVWPVHGSVLVSGGVAYVSAGRSTYLDGGIRLWGLDPSTGRIVHRGLLEGPHPSVDGERDVAFYIRGANSDVLVAEGGSIYMRQKRLTPELAETPAPVLSSKGAQDVGLHVFSTAGLLDGSWYNRTFWMYSKRWPGFQLANQAPKSGQLLVVDGERTYAVKAFYRRNVHSPMHFPGREGYLVYADASTTEPQIVGEDGSREPVAWLPQSDYSRARAKEGDRKLGSPAFGLDKMMGYTRAEPPVWMRWLPVRVRAMVRTRDRLFVAGPPDVLDPADPFAAFEGRRGARLVALDAGSGAPSEAPLELESPPVFDGLVAASGRLLVSLRSGRVVCLGGADR